MPVNPEICNARASRDFHLGRCDLLRTILTAAAIIVVFLPILSAGSMSVFKNKKYAYLLEYPSDWYLETHTDRFAIESLPPSKAIRGAVTPPGGAAIFVFVPEEIIQRQENLPQTLSSWVEAGTAHDTVTSRRKLDIETGAGPVAAVEIKTLCCAVPPFQESIDWYFGIGSRFFRASVVYWQGDPGNAGFEDKLRQVVQTLRTTGR